MGVGRCGAHGAKGYCDPITAKPACTNTSRQACSLRSNDQPAFAGLLDGSRYTSTPSASVCLACLKLSTPLCAIACNCGHAFFKEATPGKLPSTSKRVKAEQSGASPCNTSGLDQIRAFGRHKTELRRGQVFRIDVCAFKLNQRTRAERIQNFDLRQHHLRSLHTHSNTDFL